MATRVVSPIVLGLMLLTVLPAVADGASITVTPAIVVRGQTVDITGQGFTHRARATAVLSGAPRVRVRVDAHGRLHAAVQLPKRASRGSHRLVVRGGRGRVRTTLTVVSSARGPAPSTLVALSGGQRVVVAPAQGDPGAAFGLKAGGFAPRVVVQVRIAGVSVATRRVSSRRAVAIPARVPAVAAGIHRLAVTSAATRMSVRFRVTSPRQTAPAPAPAPAVAPPPPPPPTATIAAVGDIACAPGDPSFNGGLGTTTACQQAATARLASSLQPQAVLGLGDLQYDVGATSEFSAVYASTWGALDPRMLPAPGNHEYLTAGAAGYFSYFGARAGPSGLGYYSVDIGAWHIIALNSNCEAVSCAAGQPQETWLRADLAAHPNACTLAFFHHPLFSSGQGAADEPVGPFWQDLYAANADVVLVGHSHDYERFAPQTPTGAADPARGIREIVVGTGGKDMVPLGAPAPNSEARTSTTFGVLAMRLRPTGYDWSFVPAAGGTFTDSGTTACH
jgi:hypothetical protein